MDRQIECNDQTRDELEDLTHKLDPSIFIKELPEPITLVEPPFSGINCEQYTLGTNGFRHSIAAIYPKLESLKEGDFVLYYRDDRGTVHIGKLHADGSVVSKWGNGGPVLKHPIDMVPSSYGYWVFFRRIPEERLCEIQGKSAFDMIS